MDYQALLYNPIYQRLGVPATIDVGTDPVELTVIDKTRGVQIALGDVEISTVKPVACARMVELAAQGFVPADVDGSPITFNGKTWTIKGFLLKPSPNGEADGEVWFYLIEDDNS